MIRLTLPVLLFSTLASCQQDTRPISVTLHIESEQLIATVKNDSAEQIKVSGGANLGVSPGSSSIQWQVTSAGVEAGPCMHAFSPGTITKIAAGRSREFKLSTRSIERMYCLKAGTHDVEAIYFHGDHPIHSNRIRLRLPRIGHREAQ